MSPMTFVCVFIASLIMLNHCSATGEPGYKGCYTVGGSLQGVLDDDQYTLLTVDECLLMCRHWFKPIAAISNTTCFCSQRMPLGSPHANDECDLPCVGNAQQTCGGSSFYSFYSTKDSFCSPISPPRNGGIDNYLFREERNVTFFCFPGFELEGAHTIQCVESARASEGDTRFEWSGDAPSCRPIAGYNSNGTDGVAAGETADILVRALIDAGIITCGVIVVLLFICCVKKCRNLRTRKGVLAVTVTQRTTGAMSGNESRGSQLERGQSYRNFAESSMEGGACGGSLTRTAVGAASLVEPELKQLEEKPLPPAPLFPSRSGRSVVRRADVLSAVDGLPVTEPRFQASNSSSTPDKPIQKGLSLRATKKKSQADEYPQTDDHPKGIKRLSKPAHFSNLDEYPQIPNTCSKVVSCDSRQMQKSGENIPSEKEATSENYVKPTLPNTPPKTNIGNKPIPMKKVSGKERSWNLLSRVSKKDQGKREVKEEDGRCKSVMIVSSPIANSFPKTPLTPQSFMDRTWGSRYRGKQRGKSLNNALECKAASADKEFELTKTHKDGSRSGYEAAGGIDNVHGEAYEPTYITPEEDNDDESQKEGLHLDAENDYSHLDRRARPPVSKKPLQTPANSDAQNMYSVLDVHMSKHNDEGRRRKHVRRAASKRNQESPPEASPDSDQISPTDYDLVRQISERATNKSTPGKSYRSHSDLGSNIV